MKRKKNSACALDRPCLPGTADELGCRWCDFRMRKVHLPRGFNDNEEPGKKPQLRLITRE